MQVPSEKMEQDDIFLQDLILKGDDLQKLSVIQALPDLLETDHNATVARILPKIQQELPNSSTEFHIATSNLFKLLFQMNLPIHLLRPVLQGIDNKDPIIANAWIDTLLSVIPNLSYPMVMNEVLPFTLKMTQLNKTIFYRVASCKILGQLAIHPKVTQFDVRKDILPTAQSLCQDCLHEVRASMCAELPNVAKGLASDTVVKASLLPCLVELSSDENMLVRATAVDSVVHLITYLSASTVSSTIIPLVKKLCSDSCKEGEHTFTAVAKFYGTLLENLKRELTVEDSMWFFTFYVQLAKKGLTFGREDLDIETSLALMCREYCAYNLPAVTSFIQNSLPQEIDSWLTTFRDLAGDPCYLVRKAVASCIQEIARILGKGSKILVFDFVKLLRDESEEVLEALVPNISATLDILTLSDILCVYNSSQATIEIARALLKCQVEIFKYHNWRRKKKFLEQIECLPNCMPGEFIHQHFTQVIVSLSLEARARPVRTQAMKTVLCYLHASTKENHRKWIRDWMFNNLLISKSCYTRQIFINMCIEAMKIFSFKYFKEFFFLPLLTLGDDPVSTVRLCVVNLTPALKQMIVLPVDRNLQTKLDSMMSKLDVVEKDRDVIFALKCKLKELKTIHGMNTEHLIEEKRKIDEEEKLLQGKLGRSGVNPHFQRLKSSTSPSIRPLKSISRQNSMGTLKSTTSSNQSYSSSPPRTLYTSTLTNEMSFLGQHFYTDAGVILPEKSECNPAEVESIISLEEDLTKLKININVCSNCQVDEQKISTVSSENIDIENMSTEDLNVLEISTTNITDDVKVNLQKINKSKSLSKLSVETVKKRSKRYSCILPSESHLPIPNNFKRRSLGINPGEVSRIPVSFRPKTNEESFRQQKISSIPTLSIKHDVDDNSTRLKYSSKRNRSSEPLNAKENNLMTMNVEKDQNRNDECINKNEVKENIPMNSIRTNVPIKTKTGKASGLPVLLNKKARPDSAK